MIPSLALVFQFPISIHQPHQTKTKGQDTTPNTTKSIQTTPYKSSKNPEPKLLEKLSFSPFDLSHQTTVVWLQDMD
jgi:hypothetical protein